MFKIQQIFMDLGEMDTFCYGQSIQSQEGSTKGDRSSSEVTPPKPQEEGKEGKERGSRESRGKKKSSWFNSFYPSYKNKSEDFKKLFKEVPDDERLVVDYSCALQKEILHQGRLYVTQNYLCFYANIFGWETNISLKWKDVAAITKEKTALVIPNAVLISTKKDKLFFTSFVARDKTYLMLFRVWQNALMDQPMTAQEMWQWVHQCYGSELGLTSDDEDYISPTLEEDKLSVRLSVESFTEECTTYMDGTMDSVSTSDRMEIEENRTPHTMGPQRCGSEPRLPTDVTDNSESDAERTVKKKFSFSFPREYFLKEPLPLPTTPDSDDPQVNLEGFKSDLAPPRCTCPHEGRHLAEEIIPMHVDQLFTLLFTGSKFFLDFHAARKTTDLAQTPWTHDPLDGSKSRVVSSTVCLGQTMGPKSAQVTETQVMLPCSKAGHLYSVEIESINAGVPYADSFSVLVHYCLQKVSDTQSSLNVFAQVKYKKSVWGLVKGMIERNCFAGLEDFCAHLTRALHAEGEDSIPELKRKSRRKRRMHTLPKLAVEESVPSRKKSSDGIFSTEVCTLIVFSVLLLLLFLNIMLYYKLWSLEEGPPYSILDMHLLKSPPKTHEEWIKLLQHQEALHSVEAQKWQKLLKNSIHLLKQAEESLNELQRSIHSTFSSNLVSILQNQAATSDAREDL
ncbi:unnamed protein product [Phaedon cochleariae]|uniref:VASt domain-containing protein n=1 Tax=Phaedon cochleariae TaxID=80249 RepID=A0A9P0DLJ2_PHACE|nr:unnamed protein product [Phaedon cochleariae]